MASWKIIRIKLLEKWKFNSSETKYSHDNFAKPSAGTAVNASSIMILIYYKSFQYLSKNVVETNKFTLDNITYLFSLE